MMVAEIDAAVEALLREHTQRHSHEGRGALVHRAEQVRTLLACREALVRRSQPPPRGPGRPPKVRP